MTRPSPRRPRPRVRTLAVVVLAALVAAPSAQASQSVGLGELLLPGFRFIDDLFRLAEPAAPPVAAPALELSRGFVRLLQGVADATFIGATDGDLGSDTGTPDKVGVSIPQRTLVNGVTVPAVEYRLPGRAVDLGTPGVRRVIDTPAIGLPGVAISQPERRLDLAAPPVDVGPVVVRTPAVVAPPVRVTTPPVTVAPQSFDVDVSNLDVHVQRFHGTVYLGPAGSRDFAVGPYAVGQSLLPAEVPRRHTAATPGVDVLPETTWVDRPAETLVAAQTVKVTDGGRVFGGHDAGDATVPAVALRTEPVPLVPGQRHTVDVPARHVGSAAVATLVVATEAVPVSDQQVTQPAVDRAEDLFGDVDDLGYFGYGRGADSSLYPFLCTALVGCYYSQSTLGGYVNGVDRTVDAAAALVDGEVVVRLR